MNLALYGRQLSTLNQVKPATTSSSSSSSTDGARFQVEERQGYVIFKLNSPPVNTLNSRFLTELSDELDRIEQSRDIGGVILTSNLPNVLSAGVDINELYPFDPDRCAQFWTTMQELWLKLYGSSKVYIAAINGHAIGAGCLLPMSCDYRLMANGPYKIGANETLLV